MLVEVDLENVTDEFWLVFRSNIINSLFNQGLHLWESTTHLESEPKTLRNRMKTYLKKMVLIS